MGKKEGLESLYLKYTNDVYRFLLYLSKNSQVAEDLTQDTFYKAYLFLDSYADEGIRSWLFKVARNAFIDWQRREKKQKLEESSVLEELSDVGNNPEDKYLLKEALDEWFFLIKKLPEKQRKVVLLKDYLGLSYREIEESLKISASDVKVSLFRGRKKLKELNRRDDHGL